MFTIIEADGAREIEFLRRLRARTDESDTGVNAAVSRRGGCAYPGHDAVTEYSLRLTKSAPGAYARGLDRAYTPARRADRGPWSGGGEYPDVQSYRCPSPDA
jgi:hypothetical protein